MLSTKYVGRTVAFTSCPAWTGGDNGDNEQTVISGLHIVEELSYSDPTTGQVTGGYFVFPEGGEDDPDTYFFVEWDTFIEQVDPQKHGRYLAEDRYWDLKLEDRDFADVAELELSR